MKSFLQKLDLRILISGEMIKGCGEDSFFSAQMEDSAIAAVFDGCGGLGSRKYTNYRKNTGAYMAARAASGAVHDWYHELEGGRGGESGAIIAGDISEYMDAALSVVDAHAGDAGRIFGTMVRDFPTTAAIALVRGAGEGIELNCFWAGDSRVYLIDRKGLAQLTRDDVHGHNAMSNLRADGALSNVISSDKNYELHVSRTFRFRKTEPCIIFAATDGCFGYLPTPMDFEDVVLSCLLEAKTPADFQRHLEENIRRVAGDDYTLALMSFGFGSFAALQKDLRERREILQTRFIDRMGREPSQELLEHLWEEYRFNYERWLI